MKNRNISFWDERYDRSDYVYGEKPNIYFKDSLLSLNTGKILLPAEGEGRNAVFAAQQGWEVHAFDQSHVGKRKAEGLARRHQVNISYTISDVEHVDYARESFDIIAFLYAHFPSLQRRSYHHKISNYLKPGGVLILEAFSKSHVHYQSLNPQVGGPKESDMLYDLNDLKEDFSNFTFIQAIEKEILLEEGAYHVGKVSVVRIFAHKNK